MTREQPCPLNEQAVAWVLNALEPDEEMTLLHHVPQCPSCQHAVQGAEEALSHLGAAVEQVDPPPSLRASIMGAVAETPQRAPDVDPRPAPQPASREEVRRPTGAPDRTPERQGGSWFSRRRLVAASLALVAVLAIGGLTARTVQLQQQRDTVTAEAQTMTELVSQLARPGVPHAVLAGANGAAAAAVFDVDGQRQMYMIGMPANPADHTYVLWGVDGNAAPVALGAFDVAGSGTEMRTLGPVGQDDFTQYAISVEPGHTPPAAPSTVVAKGQVEV
jgi:anti-sigma-K factor RskA